MCFSKIMNLLIDPAGEGEERNLASEDAYRTLTRHWRRLIADEIATRAYYHIRGSNTKSSHRVAIPDYKARVNMLARPGGQENSGKRSLEAGRLEIIAIAQGPLTELSGTDERIGILTERPRGELRVVVGSYFARDNSFMRSLTLEVTVQGERFQEYLKLGMYPRFVNEFLIMLDKSIDALKNEY